MYSTMARARAIRTATTNAPAAPPTITTKPTSSSSPSGDSVEGGMGEEVGEGEREGGEVRLKEIGLPSADANSALLLYRKRGEYI